MNRAKIHGMTLIELTVVILILSILASISLSVYTGYVQRARFTTARATIREMDVSCRRYQIDLNEFPPSYSETSLPTLISANPTSPFAFGNIGGCGNMILALTRGIVGAPNTGFLTGAITTDPRWFGPYMSIRQDLLGDFATSGGPIHRGIVGIADTLPGNLCLLDPWGRSYTYVRFNDYDLFGANTDFDATIIVNSPFVGTLQVPSFYNPQAFQIYSVGPNGGTLVGPLHGLDGMDDQNNFNTQ